MRMKGRQLLWRKKIITFFLVLCVSGVLVTGICIEPEKVEASGLVLSIEPYRGLSKEVTVPVSVENPSGLVALTFKITPENSQGGPLRIAVQSITRGADLPVDAEVTSYIHPDKTYATVGIYLLSSNFTQNMNLVNITFSHDEAEGAGPFALELSDVTAYNKDGDPIASSTVSGYLDVKIMYGDLNRSETVTVADALLAMNAVVGNLSLTQALKDAANVSRSASVTTGGNVTIYDALLIAQRAADIISYFPVNSPVEASPPPPAPNVVNPQSLTISSPAAGSNTRTFTVGFPENVSGIVRLTVKEGGAEGTVKGQCDDLISNNNEINLTWNMANLNGDTLIINHLTQDQSEKSDSLIYTTNIPPSAGVYPVIGTSSTINIDDVDPTITLILQSGTFDTDELATENHANWFFDNGSTALGLGSITRVSDTRVTVALTGTASAGTLTIRPNASALTGSKNSNDLEIAVY